MLKSLLAVLCNYGLTVSNSANGRADIDRIHEVTATVAPDKTDKEAETKAGVKRKKPEAENPDKRKALSMMTWTICERMRKWKVTEGGQ